MKKKYQVILEDAVHKRIKQRAAELGISLSNYIENLVGAMEHRAYHHVKGQLGGIATAEAIRLCVMLDHGQITKEEFDAELGAPDIGEFPFHKMFGICKES